MKKNDLIKILATALYRAALDKKGEELKKITANFASYISRRNWEFMMPQIIKFLENLELQEKNTMRVTITSHFPLTSMEKKTVFDMVEKNTGKSCLVEELISEDLLGGVKVRYGDKLFDTSLKKTLRELKSQLAK